MPARSSQLDPTAWSAAADCLRVLAHPHRLQIIQVLQNGGRLSVGQIATACDLPQPTTSDHLRLMRRCGFLDNVRDGRMIYYSIVEPHVRDILSCIQNRFG